MRYAPLVLLLSCASEPEPAPRLTPAEQAVRASMALRGVRPTVEELERIGADPAALPELVEGWVLDPRFEETVRDLHAEALWLRTKTINVLPPIGPLEGYTRGEMDRSVSEAPLRLVGRVVSEGRPYHEILTTDETVVDALLAEVYGLPFDPSGPAWQVATWDDGRPAAGILATNGMWLRHMSSDTNHNRARAATVLRALLCDDLTDRDLGVLGIDLEDPDAVVDAVSTEPGCVSCHQDIDPLAGAFWGFKRYILRVEVADAYAAGCPDPDFCYPLRFYDPATEGDWALHGLPSPSFDGRPLGDLGDLAQAVADDPRFPRCTARRFAAWFGQTDLDAVDEATIDALVEVFEDSGRDARALAAAVVTDPAFLSVDRPPLVVRPEQYARMLEDLTGYRWSADPDLPGCEEQVPTCWGAIPLLQDDRFGFRVLAGGTDGLEVRLPTHAPTPTAALVWQEAATQAAGFVVDSDLALPASERRLLGLVEADTVDEVTVRTQIAWLHARILGEEVLATGPVVGNTWRLWSEARGRGGVRHAWRLVVTALLIDPRAVTS